MGSPYDSWLVLGYGAGLFYLLVHPSHCANASALRRAFQFYALSLSCALTATLSSCIFSREAHDINRWIEVAFWGLFLFSLMQFWKAIRGADLF